MRQQQGGYVALLVVLIVGTASLAIATALLIGGTDTQRMVLAEQRLSQARNLAAACSEEGLQVIRDNNAYTGSGSLTLGQGSCTYTVTNTGTSTRTIDTTGTVSGVVRKVKVYVTIGTSSISVTSWQEV